MGRTAEVGHDKLLNLLDCGSPSTGTSASEHSRSRQRSAGEELAIPVLVEPGAFDIEQFETWHTAGARAAALVRSALILIHGRVLLATETPSPLTGAPASKTIWTCFCSARGTGARAPLAQDVAVRMGESLAHAHGSNHRVSEGGSALRDDRWCFALAHSSATGDAKREDGREQRAYKLLHWSPLEIIQPYRAHKDIGSFRFLVHKSHSG
jgi:hypothetical protein